MIRKALISAFMGLSLTALAGTQTVVVQPGTMTNLLSTFNGSTLLKQVVVTANTTNASLLFVDTATNTLGYVNASYTNTYSYATNYITSWTNFYGVAQTSTNVALVDNTNNVVAATTNSYPVNLAATALASTTATYVNINRYFMRGIWATNNSSGIATVTVTW